MSFLQVIVMGIVQGLTEFLPVGSAGQLAFHEHWVKGDVQLEMLLTVMLHVGTLVAVFLVFKGDIRQILVSLKQMTGDIIENIKIFFRNKRNGDALRFRKILNNNYRNFAAMILVSLIPTVVIGLLLRSITYKMSGSLLATSAGILITAVFLLVANFASQGKKVPVDIDYKIALVIGICQGFTVLPGVSRAGITIVACLLCGFSVKFAVKYSFILSIPTIIGAAIVAIVTVPKGSITIAFWGYCVVGMIIAAVIGVVCINFMLRLIKKSNLKYFAGYCLVMGLLAIGLNFL